MTVVVRKYGGSSLADISCLRRVARSIAGSDDPVVVVVSAQGDTTDRLLATAAEAAGVSPQQQTPSREVDQLVATGELACAALLALHLRALGVPAVSLSGAQAGITVSGPAGEGLVAEISTGRIERLLAEGNVVVVAGFQGVDEHGDVVTLGRGGSDTTAVALAAALGADSCQIYTDVDAVYDADPRVVPQARELPVVQPQVMVEMAFAGARVLHSRSVELAVARGIEVHVRSSFRPGPGTVIPGGSGSEGLEDLGIVAVVHDLDVVRVLVRSDRGHGDPAIEVLNLFAHHHAPVDLVARSGPYEDEFRMGLLMRRSDLPAVRPDLTAAVTAGGGSVRYDEEVAKVSLVGTGLLNRPHYTARLLSALAAAGIATNWVSMSQLRTSVAVAAEWALDAVAVLHEEFGLGRRHADPPRLIRN
ncbi:aspartate kinase [Micromonospora sp. NPDC049523]|uniref:aspartate kinase n=1 Tax=Micromonospora sp. NPDC049523 TaxID=3155921 RepID=UPI003437081B